MPINSFLYPGAKFTPPYEVANSLRFNDGSSDYLSKTFGTPTSTKKGTHSVWFKLSTLKFQNLIGLQDGSTGMDIGIDSSHRLNIFSSNTAPSAVLSLDSTQVLRDPSAWYHVVVAIDTTQATASNRVKVYLNGTQITDFDTETYPSLNDEPVMCLGTDNTSTFIGASPYGGGANFFDGYMAEYVYVDGSQLDADQFGEFDSDTNIWKPIDVSGLTFGNNGFYLDFENASSLGADVSGNGNNFTVNNLTSIDQTTDTCTNNYCTLSQLWNFNGNFTLSDGNLNFIGTGNNDGTAGTMGVSSGKWYFEAEFDTNSSACYAGWGDAELLNTTGTGNPITAFIGMYRDDYTIQIGGGSVTTYTTVSDGDIFGFAINLDASSGSKTVIVQKNGSTIDTITIPTANENNFFIPVSGDTSSTDGRLKFNFGNPFETLSSGNSDANGYGNFEYSPTINSVNYYALNSKNLAEYG